MTYKQPIRMIRQRLTWGPSQEIRYSDPFDAGISYRVFMARDFAGLSMNLPFKFADKRFDEDLGNYLQVPHSSTAFQELTDDFAVRYPDPTLRAQAIESWLRSSFGYTRSEFRKVPKKKSPVDAFLFDWKEGNCEFFSTAMVLLLRNTGIPARNVAGFLGGQWNRIGNYLIIREGDAHSWVEAHLPDRGWVMFDPTPASSSPDFITNPFFTTLLQFFDVVSLAWQKHVIAYDLSRQSKFMKAGYDRFMKWRSSAGSLGRNVSYDFGSEHKRILIVLIMLVVWLVYFASIRKETMLAAPMLYRQSVSVRKAVNLLSILDRRLETLGLHRPPSRPPLKHGRFISTNMKDSASMLEIVEVYNETRFGSRMLPPQEYRDLVQRIKVLE
jgi:hypothetical protein